MFYFSYSLFIYYFQKTVSFTKLVALNIITIYDSAETCTLKSYRSQKHLTQKEIISCKANFVLNSKQMSNNPSA